jgi:hypothetical protein
MKKSVTFFLLILFSLGLCLAQSPKEVISQDPLKAGGTFYVYDYNNPPLLSPMPNGYEPFYISHFARHGARFCTSEYDSIHNWLSKAAEADILTEGGKAFFARYEKFYNKVRYSRGNLTDLGKAQHRAIAEHMYQRFPQVFDGPTHVEAASTESARVIMSMWSCLSSLQALDGDMDVKADASASFATWLQPSLSSSPYYRKEAFKSGQAADDAVRDYFLETVPWKDITERFFTSADALESSVKLAPRRFIDCLYSVVTDTQCLDEDRGCFDDIFSPDELYALWKASSASYFSEVANFDVSECLRVDYAAFTLGNIIDMADADIASGNTQLRLRFGHDSGIAPLMVLLDADGCGRATSSLEESLEIFPSYTITMGASVQLVFFRNADGDILVTVLINERQASLPLEAVSGYYYSWDDFKEYYLPIVRASQRKIVYQDAYAALGAVDWSWRPVGSSKVEAAYASVNVFNSVQSISLVRFPIKDHSVSVVESDGPKALITSQFGTKNKALAAINGSYFDKEVMPVTFVKDNGRVLSTSTADGPTRSNGMFRIKDKKGRKVDILSVDSLSIAGAAKGWREAIVSGPVLIEEGVPVYYPNDGSRSYRRFYSKRHPRTLLGYTTDGWLYFIVVDGRFPARADGMSIDELEVLCESLGLWEAINLDGGGSSTLWTRDGGVLNHPYDNQVFDHEGERTVPNAIIVR